MPSRPPFLSFVSEFAFRVHLCTFAVLGLAYSLPALGEAPRVAVVYSAALGSERALAGHSRKMQTLLESAVQSGGAISLQPEFSNAVQALSRTDAVALRRKAVQQLDALAFDGAAKSLKTILALAQADPLAVNAQLVAETQVKLASTFFRLNEEKEAKKTLNDLARQYPGIVLSTGLAPVFQLELDKAKRRSAKLPSFPISIDGPEKAMAFVDGEFRGPLPLKDLSLSQGVHHLRIFESTTDGDVLAFGKALNIKEQIGVRVRLSPLAPQQANKTNFDLLTGDTIDEVGMARMLAFARKSDATHVMFIRLDSIQNTSQTKVVSVLCSVERSAIAVLPSLVFSTAQSPEPSRREWHEAVVSSLLRFESTGELPLSIKQPATPARNGLPLAAKTEVPPASPSISRPLLKDPSVNAPSRLVESESAPAAKKPIPTWVWVTGGIAAAAAVGVSTYFVYSAVSKPTTGTVTATW